jgi:monofunctional biosynthetic peptidoglycan transglycosylase
MIELLWSKKRILEMYINVIEMGDGIYGIEAASKQYFRKSAKSAECRRSGKNCSLLCPNPKKYKVKPLSAWVSFRTPWVMSQMEELMNDEDIQKLIRD